MAYCMVADLLLGNIPTPAYIDKQKSVDAAAEEMDSYLAMQYVTPISQQIIDNPVNRRTMLVLKRINAHLATGRIITAAAAGAEDSEIHAYGKMMLDQALSALAQLATGTPSLDGATPVDNNKDEANNRPSVVNGDPYSQVDAFYDIATPGSMMAPGGGQTFGYPFYGGPYYGGG